MHRTLRRATPAYCSERLALRVAYKALLPYQTFRTKTRDLALAVGSESLTRTYEEWETLLLGHGIPVGAINNLAQVVEHPPGRRRRALVEMDHPRAGKVRMSAHR